MVKKGSGKGSTSKRRARKSKAMKQQAKGREQAAGKDQYKDPRDGQQEGR